MTTTIGSLDLNAFSDLYSDSTQYFWFEPNSSATYGAGAHVTLVPDTSFISNPTGQNILMNTDGFSIRNGLLPMMTLDNNSLDFNVVDTTEGTYTTTATFTATGAQIGQNANGKSRSEINQSGMQLYRKNNRGIDIQIANFGYGEGSTQLGTLSDNPYYSLGVRWVSQPSAYSQRVYSLGNLCTYNDKVYVCIFDITTPEAWNSSHWAPAIGNYSVSEGYRSQASGAYSHAEGEETLAAGGNSHAEGYRTYALGARSHTEGYLTYAKGGDSHASGYRTTAGYDEQFVIGKRNDNNRYNAFEIGNGSDDSGNSNAFAVDWNGKIQTSQMQAGTIAATSVSANSYKDVSVTFSSEMSDVPTVVCGVVSTSTAGAIGSITSAVTSTSTTGFTCRIFNAGSTARTPAVNWIALNV